ncbi:MAG: hypothetical protein ACRDO1_09685 [Nocardioidaceae bacterium]
MRRLIQLTPLRLLAAPDTARRNAATAIAVLAQHRRERDDVEEFLAAMQQQ